MAEIKKDAPKMENSKWKITNLGGNHLFIHDPNKGAGANGKPFGWVMSDSEAMTKFSNVGKKFDEDDLDLHNQVMSYLSSKHSTAPKTVNGAPVDTPKRGRPATGRKEYDHAAYQKAYRDRQKQKKIEAEKAKKAGI